MMVMTIAFSLFTGCANQESPKQQTLETEVSEPQDTQQEQENPPGLEDDTIGEGTLEPEEQAISRNQMRMTIDQLKTSMEQLTGGIEWKSGNTDLWAKYETTLGVPDYMEVVSEDLTSSVIFQKFLGDAATYSCEQWIENDVAATDKRFFVNADASQTEEDAVRQNIVHLRYLIHGHKNTVEDEVIDSYYRLFYLVMQRTDDSIAAWNTVCVGFFTHPDFFTY